MGFIVRKAKSARLADSDFVTVRQLRLLAERKWAFWRCRVVVDTPESQHRHRQHKILQIYETR
jgi:hypothetical protein